MLEYLNCHAYVLFSLLLANLAWQQFACFSLASVWLLLVIAIITAYPITSDGTATKYIEGAGSLPLS